MIGFVVNPASAGGKTGKIWQGLEIEINQRFGVRTMSVPTIHPLHATEITRKLLTAGINTIIAVGGDGTLNEVVNGFFNNDTLINKKSAVGMISMGSGGDFIRSINFPREAMPALDRIEQRQVKLIDVGKATFLNTDNKRISRYFINITDFGIGGAVVNRVNTMKKIFGGTVSYYHAILTTLLTYHNKELSFKLDNSDWKTETLNNFIVGNGRYFGGGLNPTPMAKLDDGLFDVVTFGDISRISAVMNLGKLKKGKHLEHPKVHSCQTKKIKAKSDKTIFIDLDGESVGKLPIEIELLPKAIPVLV